MLLYFKWRNNTHKYRQIQPTQQLTATCSTANINTDTGFRESESSLTISMVTVRLLYKQSINEAKMICLSIALSQTLENRFDVAV